jgi:hypothetical protein
MPINYLAVLVAAVVCFVIGFLIHGPIAGKLWMRLANIHPTGKEKLSDMFPQMLSNFIMNLICAYVLAVVYLFATTSPYMGGSGAANGMVCAFWLWLGFNFTSTSMDVIWMNKKKELWLFELCSSLICYLAMGAVIASM